MRIDQIHPQLRSAYRFLPNPPIGNRFLLQAMQAAYRVRLPVRVPKGMHHRREAGLHIYSPDRPRGALLWVHGGGLVIGSAAQDHGRCLAWARHLQILVVSVEYRLAPRHPFPAAHDDCYAAWQWTLRQTDRIAIGGQSAGGGLAAGLVQRIADEGATQPLAQWLFCPMLDDRTAAEHSLDRQRHFIWNNASNRVGWNAYLAGQPPAPYASPGRRTDLRGLPPTWLGVGTADLFHDEIVDYAGHLHSSGVECVLDTVSGGPHAFESVVPRAEVSRDYSARAVGWLAERLG